MKPIRKLEIIAGGDRKCADRIKIPGPFVGSGKSEIGQRVTDPTTFMIRVFCRPAPSNLREHLSRIRVRANILKEIHSGNKWMEWPEVEADRVMLSYGLPPFWGNPVNGSATTEDEQEIAALPLCQINLLKGAN